MGAASVTERCVASIRAAAMALMIAPGLAMLPPSITVKPAPFAACKGTIRSVPESCAIVRMRFVAEAR